MARAITTRSNSVARICHNLGLVALACLLQACASSDGPKQATLPTTVNASPDINPNRRGTPQPVKLHIYYLGQDEAFMQANFSDLIAEEPAVIAEDLLRRTETLIGPGETQPLDEQFDEQTAFIGIVAEFTNVEDATWRALVAVPEGSWKDLLRPFKSKRLVLDVGVLSVSGAIIED